MRDEAGRLSVTWALTRDEGAVEHVALNWVESGVNLQPEKAARRGYGRELIEKALACALKGRTEDVLGADCVCCRIERPII
ncbi:hypothetical protein [Methylobacterium sp. ID0610]|uniref:hypothetical protein n=1 Tax=Methylobacterium carpenticola TaxID=3344827 RepID=UPI0036B73422